MMSTEIQATDHDSAELVGRFYERVLADPSLRPVFESTVTDWRAHHGIVQDIWSRMLLGTNRYQGSPYRAHTGLQLCPEHFERWLALFGQTAEEVLPPVLAQRAVERAEQISASIQAGLFTFDHPVPPPRFKPAR